MKRLLISFALVLVSALPCAAIPITLFIDIPTFLERSRDLVIARCTRPDLDQGPYIDGLHPAEVEVVSVLKGNKDKGKLRIATIYNLEAGKTYLLACGGGGLAHETDFLAIAERSVVKLPDSFRLEDLKGKKLAKQVQTVFTAAGLSDKDLLLNRLKEPLPIVMQTPPDAAGVFEKVDQQHKERIARAVQKLQQSKGDKEMRETLREIEEAVKAMQAALASRGSPTAPGKP